MRIKAYRVDSNINTTPSKPSLDCSTETNNGHKTHHYPEPYTEGLLMFKGATSFIKCQKDNFMQLDDSLEVFVVSQLLESKVSRSQIAIKCVNKKCRFRNSQK